MRSAVVVLVLAGCGRVAFDTATDARSADARDADPAALPGLQVWLPLDETEGIVIHDMSGQGNGGTIGNNGTQTWQPTGGVVGGALQWVSGYAMWPSSTPGNCRSIPAITSSFTASLWVTFDSFGDWGGYSLGDVAMMQGTPGGGNGAWGIGATNGCGGEHAAFEVAPTASARRTICSTTSLAPSTWYHLTGVYDASVPSISIYVNGVLDNGALTPNSVALGSSITAGTACPYLAAGQNQFNRLAGSLDEVRFYNRALTAAEVDIVYRASGG